MRLLILPENKIISSLEFSTFVLIIAILSCKIELIDILRVSLFGIGVIIYYVLAQFQKNEKKPIEQPQEQVPIKLESIINTIPIQSPQQSIICNAEIIMDDFLTITNHNDKMRNLLKELNFESPSELLNDIIITNIDSVAKIKLKKWKKQSTLFELIQMIRNRGSELNIQVLEHNNQNLKSYLIQCFYKNQFIIQFIETSERDSLIKKQQMSQLLHQLFSTFSHEFGTLLNYLLALSQVAIDQFPQQNDFFSPIKSIGLIMHHFVSDMVDYSDMLSKQFQLQFVLVNIQELIEDVINFYKKQIETKGLTIEYEIKFEEKETLIDGKRCKQVLSNLISNAQKFTVSGGIKICVFEQVNYIVFSVEDTGLGMSDETFHNLKQKLEQNVQSEQKISVNTAGFGLGCYLSHQIALKLSDLPTTQGGGLKYVRQKQGTRVSFKVKNQPFKIIYNSFEISSQQGKSGIFQFDNGYFDQRQSVIDFGINQKKFNQYEPTQHSKFRSEIEASFSPYKMLDVVECELKDQNEILDRLKQFMHTKTRVGQKSPTFGNLNAGVLSSQTLQSPPLILIVDDEMINIISLSILLKQFNIECHKAFNGSQALEKVKELKDRYDIIFMDINMPIMDGFLATEKILSYDSKNVIIACTAFTDIETKSKCYNVGMKYFLNKPITKVELHNLLSHLNLIIK